jgi:hypothetical protein
MYAIRRHRTFYASPLGARITVEKTWVCDDAGLVLTFSTRARARAWIGWACANPYELAHGECQRPEYSIRWVAPEIADYYARIGRLVESAWPGSGAPSGEGEPEHETSYIATDDYCRAIYGVGKSPEAAIADARSASGDEGAEFVTFRASRALCDRVALDGGAAVSWTLCNGVAVLLTGLDVADVDSAEKS